ncbi:hypothetical protein H2203_008998 [Taxawa tesnikishii (nom. ined.)]|nr:hypothetical protein H2203_008998 [Dothideales sp. JES 119]
MPLIVAPSDTTAKVYSRMSKRVLHLDIFLLCGSLLTFEFSLVDADQRAANYKNPFGKAVNPPTEAEARAIFYLLGTLVPLLSALSAAANIYACASRTLEPAFALATSIPIALAWFVFLVINHTWGAASKWGPAHGMFFERLSRGIDPSATVFILMLIGGWLTFVLELAHVAIDAKAVHQRRKQRRAERLTTEAVQRTEEQKRLLASRGDSIEESEQFHDTQ